VYHVKNLSQQRGREPTRNSTHIWRRPRDWWATSALSTEQTLLLIEWKECSTGVKSTPVFHTKSPRIILRIFWPSTISNQQLFARCFQDIIETTIMRSRSSWIGHVLRKEPGNITRTDSTTLDTTRQAKERPKSTWRRTVEGETKTLNHTCRGTIRRPAQNRQERRTFLAALRASGHWG